MDYYSLWPELPIDVRGIRSRENFVPFQVAGYGHQRSTGFNAPYIPCARRSIHLQSATERALLFSLVLKPNLLDVREHYPAYDPERVCALQAKGKRIRKSEVPTIDAVATFGNPDMTLSYVGYTVKESGQLDREHIWRRVERERAFCRNIGWGARLFTEQEINPVEVCNAKLLLSWANSASVQDEEVRDIALAVFEQRNGVLLRDALRTASRVCCIESYRASALFSHAVLRGWLNVDTSSTYIGLVEPLSFSFKDVVAA